MNNFPLSLYILALAGTPVLTAAGPHPYAPELSAKTEQLRGAIQAQGLPFQVGLNPAMQYDRERLCGTRIELMPPEYLAHEPGGFENYEVQATPAALPKAFTGVFSGARPTARSPATVPSPSAAACRPSPKSRC